MGPPGENNSMHTDPELVLPVTKGCILDLSKSAAVKWKRPGRRPDVEDNVISTMEKDLHSDGQEEMCY